MFGLMLLAYFLYRGARVILGLGSFCIYGSNRIGMDFPCFDTTHLTPGPPPFRICCGLN